MLVEPLLHRLSYLIGGVPIDELQIIIALLSTYPLAFYFRTLPHDRPELKHWFSIVSTLALFIVLQNQLVGAAYVAVAAGVAFLMYRIRAKWMPEAVMTVLMLYLTYR